MNDILQQLNDHVENQLDKFIELVKIETVKELAKLLDLWIHLHTNELEQDK